MLDADDGDDFIVDIVQSVCDSALDVIYKSYIQKQLIPYTVVLAKDAILQIIEVTMLVERQPSMLRIVSIFLPSQFQL